MEQTLKGPLWKWALGVLKAILGQYQPSNVTDIWYVNHVTETFYILLFPGKVVSWSCSHGSWIYNYLFNQCQSLLTLWVWIMLKQGVLGTTLYDKVCKYLTTSHWISLVSFTNKTDRYDITEIFLKMVLNTINQTK
jgi:hypothetical protein